MQGHASIISLPSCCSLWKNVFPHLVFFRLIFFFFFSGSSAEGSQWSHQSPDTTAGFITYHLIFLPFIKLSDLIDDCYWHHHWSSSSFSRRGNIVNHAKVLKILHFSCPHTEFHTASWWFILLLFCSLDSHPLNAPSVVFQDFISVEILIVQAKS